jgi:hypothetical protein
MLQQCSSASSCMRTRIFVEDHYTACQHSTSFLLNGPTQFFSASLHFWRYCGPVLHEFHHQYCLRVPS